MTARHAIFCPAHAVPAYVVGDARLCGHGQHRLVRWWVVDVRHQLVLEEVSDEDCRELRQPLATCPRLSLEDVSLTEKERKSMPRGVPGSGPYGDPTKAAQPPKPKPRRGKSCIESTKLQCGGCILWLRLVVADIQDESTRYRVRWELIDEKGQSESGVAVAVSDEAMARGAFNDAVEKAKADRWAPAAAGHLELKPVPAPPGKGRKAA